MMTGQERYDLVNSKHKCQFAGNIFLMAVILTYARCVDGKKTWFSSWSQTLQEGQTTSH